MPKLGLGPQPRSGVGRPRTQRPGAVGHGWRGREQTPDERVGSRQPQTSDHCRLQLQDAQTQNVRSARWFPGVPESREHNGTEFGSDSNHAAHGIAARFPRTRL